MEIQEVTDKLTQGDRIAIKDILSCKYSGGYVRKMFLGTRKPTELFKKTVADYLESKEKITTNIQNQ